MHLGQLDHPSQCLWIFSPNLLQILRPRFARVDAPCDIEDGFLVDLCYGHGDFSVGRQGCLSMSVRNRRVVPLTNSQEFAGIGRSYESLLSESESWSRNQHLA